MEEIKGIISTKKSILGKINVTSPQSGKEEEEKTLDVTDNGEYTVIPTSGKVMNKVSVNVNVFGEKLITINKIYADGKTGIHNYTHTVTEAGVYLACSIIGDTDSSFSTTGEVLYCEDGGVNRKPRINLVKCNIGDTITLYENNKSGSGYYGVCTAIVKFNTNINNFELISEQNTRDGTSSQETTLQKDNAYFSLIMMNGNSISRNFEQRDENSFVNTNNIMDRLQCNIIYPKAGNSTIYQSAYGQTAGASYVGMFKII